MKINSREINYDPTTFIPCIREMYQSSLINLEDITQITQKRLKETQSLNNSATLSAQQIKTLEADKNILCLLIEGKKDYYKNTFIGIISNIFQKLGEIFNLESSLSKANNVVQSLTNFIEQSNELKQETDEYRNAVNLETLTKITRLYSLSTKTRSRLFAKKLNPNLYIFCDIKGNAISFDYKKPFAKGSGRAVYKGTLFSNQQEAKEIAIITPLTCFQRIYFGDECLETTNDQILEDINKLEKENFLLNNDLKDVEGIIKFDDFYSTSKIGQNFSFACCEYYPIGNLERFLLTDAGKALTAKQKKHLICSLLKTFKELHAKGYIHRDVKPENIVIEYDKENDLYFPVLIDFEACISANDEERKKETCSTLAYWPPEYLEAANNSAAILKDEIAKVTSSKMDIWALGLIIYNLWHGKDFLVELGINKKDLPDSEFRKKLEEIFRDKEKLQSMISSKSNEFTSLISQMLSLDPVLRPEATQILNIIASQLDLFT